MISANEFYQLIRVENYEQDGLPDFLAYRVRAAAALAYCAGLCFPEVLALRRSQWCPNGLPKIVIDGFRVEDGRREHQALPRTIPVSPAARCVVGQYLAALPDPPTPECRFFDLPERPALKAEIGKAVSKAEMETSIKPGDLRASFEVFIKDQNPGSDLAFYLVGARPTAGMVYRFGSRPPPMKDLVQLLKTHQVYGDGDERLRARRRRPRPAR
jgi:integrase